MLSLFFFVYFDRDLNWKTLLTGDADQKELYIVQINIQNSNIYPDKISQQHILQYIAKVLNA